MRATPTAPALRRARAEDAAPLHALIAAAGRHLLAQGFDNWTPPYPLERFAADVAAGTVYGAWDAAGPVATFTLASAPPRPYERTGLWAEPDAPARYLNRLAIDPARQRAGLGGWCLARIDDLARDAGARAVRCDVLFANAGVRAFYERHGYRLRGERAHGGRRFATYERVTGSATADPPNGAIAGG